MEKQVLDILKRLESFREKINKGEIQEGTSDWIIRMCEAEVAQGHFENRSQWTNKIN